MEGGQWSQWTFIRRLREGKPGCGGKIEVDSCRIMPMEKGLSKKTIFFFWRDDCRIVVYRKRASFLLLGRKEEGSVREMELWVYNTLRIFYC